MDTSEYHLSKRFVPVQALAIASRIVDALGKFRHGATLSQIAEETKIPASKVHRYLSTMMSLNYVSQSHRTGRYNLGSAAITLGLTAMRQVDLFSRVTDSLEALCTKTGAHVFMSIWTTAGPMLLRWVYSEDQIASTNMPGQILSLTRTSSGQVFAAFLPPARTASILEKELYAVGKSSDHGRKLAERIQHVVENKYARTIGEAEPHIQSVAVPVFDWLENWLIAVGCALDIDANETIVDRVIEILLKYSSAMSIRPTLDLVNR